LYFIVSGKVKIIKSNEQGKEYIINIYKEGDFLGYVELLEDSNQHGIINRFIEKKGEGVHHIAFAVKNIVEEVERLKSAGFEFIQEEPKRGADNKLVCFLHPKGTNGVLIELCQEIE
jgi:methylmalonyl-CoA/ethylmalonyl-CoA epimerase